YLRTLAASDKRIDFHAPVPVTKVASTLRQCDVLAVPSQWLETGPLVVLEAFAANVPVLGSRLGGIAELVRNGFDGILVEASNIDEWAATLKRLSQEMSLVERLKANIRPPRTMANVAEDMLKIYTNASDVRSIYKPRRLSPVTAQLSDTCRKGVPGFVSRKRRARCGHFGFPISSQDPSKAATVL